MNSNNENSAEDDFLNRFLSEEFLAEQRRLHQKMDEHLKKHYNYEHDEEAVHKLLSEYGTDDDELWGGLCNIGPVRILVHEYTPGVLKRKA